MKNRARAIIEDNGCVLLIHRTKSDREYWTFPGGGGEDVDASLEDTVIRECKEELGVTVCVLGLYAEIEPTDEQTHCEFFFRCTIESGVVGSGTGPEFSRDLDESGTYEPQWVPKRALSSMTVFPYSIKESLWRE
ncbi:MAG: NUDIX domain-containing protein [Patescibacteria group bacterium]